MERTVALFLCAFRLVWCLLPLHASFKNNNEQVPADLLQSHVTLDLSVNEATWGARGERSLALWAIPPPYWTEGKGPIFQSKQLAPWPLPEAHLEDQDFRDEVSLTSKRDEWPSLRLFSFANIKKIHLNWPSSTTLSILINFSPVVTCWSLQHSNSLFISIIIH